MKPGQVIRHRKIVTHYVERDHVVVARRVGATWLVTETTACGAYGVLHRGLAQDEAELLAETYAAMRSHRPATPDHTEA